jgi:hypothetical protein
MTVWQAGQKLLGATRKEKRGGVETERHTWAAAVGGRDRHRTAPAAGGGGPGLAAGPPSRQPSCYDKGGTEQ